MSPFTKTVPILVVLMSLDVLPALAQGMQEHGKQHGFWAGLGFGYGSARSSCDNCSNSPRLGGWTFSGDFGWMPGQHVRVGVEFREWLNGLKKNSQLPVITAATMLMSYYARTGAGPFVDGGVGLSHYMIGKGTGDPIEPFSRDTTYASGAGWGYTLGVGWTVRSLGNSFTPRVTYAFGNKRTLHTPDGAPIATGWEPRVLLIEGAWRGGPF